MGYLRGWVITWWMMRVSGMFRRVRVHAREREKEREKERISAKTPISAEARASSIFYGCLSSLSSLLSPSRSQAKHHHYPLVSRLLPDSLHWVICERERATHVSVSPALILHESAGRMWTEIFYYLPGYQIPMHNFPVELRISIDKVHMYLHALLSHSTHSS